MKIDENVKLILYDSVVSNSKDAIQYCLFDVFVDDVNISYIKK